MLTVRRFTSSVLAGLGLLGLGCGEELGPVTITTTRVRGVVTQRGSAVTRGWIEFLPIQGTVGNLRVAPIQPDGSFDATGVAVGRNFISIVHAVRGEPHLLRDVPGGPPSVLPIELGPDALWR